MKLRNITRDRGKGVFLCISGADHGVQWLNCVPASCIFDVFHEEVLRF